MKMLFTVVLTMLLALATTSQATIIQFNGMAGGNNNAMPSTFGSNISSNIGGAAVSNGATTNIALAWAGGGAGGWDLHGSGVSYWAALDSTWSTSSTPTVAQMESPTAASPNTVTFMVDADKTLQLNSVDIGMATDKTDTYYWAVTISAVGGAEVFSTLTAAMDGDGGSGVKALTVDFNFTGALGTNYVLAFNDVDSLGNDTINTNGGAIDNLSFNQIPNPPVVPDPDPDPDPDPRPAGVVLVEAHRGNARFAPENTIASINAAAGIADLTEFDVQVSSDGKLVLMHDGTVTRTTNGSGSVSSMTLAQLKTLDAGSWFSSSFAGEQVPTMTEAMDAAIAANIEPLVERKSGSAAAYHAEFVAEGFSPTEFRIISFSSSFLEDMDDIDSEYQLGFLGGGTITQAVIDGLLAKGIDFLDWSHGSIDQAAVDLVHANGMELHVWTVDGAARMQQLIDFGVDGITTNDPALLRSLVPVPEPATMFIMLAAGLPALLKRRRRRKA